MHRFLNSAAERYSLLYTPKCACTPLRQFFVFVHWRELRDEQKKVLAHKKWHAITPLSNFIGSETPSPTSTCVLAVVRSPYERAVSMYADIIVKNGVTCFAGGSTFREFALWLPEHTQSDIHFYPQYCDALAALGDKLRIVRVEDFYNELAAHLPLQGAARNRAMAFLNKTVDWARQEHDLRSAVSVRYIDNRSHYDSQNAEVRALCSKYRSCLDVPADEWRTVLGPGRPIFAAREDFLRDESVLCAIERAYPLDFDAFGYARRSKSQ